MMNGCANLAISAPDAHRMLEGQKLRWPHFVSAERKMRVGYAPHHLVRPFQYVHALTVLLVETLTDAVDGGKGAEDDAQG